ncbi:hypothetical protein PTKIN_Ptkin07bG0092600 [Pterospermum kingtungense]
MSCLKTGDLKWFFYCPIEKKYARGSRFNRATVHGYWKTTGKDRPVKDDDDVVGMIKTLVFHRGKAPHGERTDWVMHEYRLTDMVQDTYVLCVLFKKDGMGPRNGAQYGAPFKEEDWSDDEDVSSSLSGLPLLAVGGASSSCVQENKCAGPSVESVGLYTQSNANVSVIADTFVDPACMDAPLVQLVERADAPPQVQVVARVDFPPRVPVDAPPQVPVDAPQVPMVADAKAVLAPQLAPTPRVQESNDNILSMLDIFTDDDDAFITYYRGQMLGNAIGNANNYILEAPQVSTGNANNFVSKAPQVSDDEDILFMLESFKEDNYLNNVLYPFE